MSKRQRKGEEPRQLSAPLGRPSHITPAFTQRVCARVENGLRLPAALEAEGVSPRCIEKWRSQADAGREPYADFFGAVARARSAFEQSMLDQIRLQAKPTQAGEESDWKARAWLLERTMPETYAPSQQLVIRAQVAAANDVLTAARECLPSEWYAVLLARLAGDDRADDDEAADEAH
jgi:hypothetical protein